MREELGFWLAVMVAAVVGLALFKLVAAKVGDRVPGLAELAAFV